MSTTAPTFHPADLAARHLLARALAHALADPQLGSPPEPDAPEQLKLAWALLAQSLPATTRSELGLGELPAEEARIEDLTHWLALPRHDRAAAHQAVFGLVVSKECPAYETEFCHWSDPTFRAQQMADIAGFYQAFGLEVSRACAERMDHVSIEIEFIAFLALKLRGQTLGEHAEAAQITSDALAAFLRDHAVWWMPTFARCVENKAERLLQNNPEEPLAQGVRALAGVARFLRAWVALERQSAGVEPSRRIISPQVQPLPTDDSCEGAGEAFSESPSPGTPGEGRGGGNEFTNLQNSPEIQDPKTPTLALPRSTGRGDKRT